MSLQFDGTKYRSAKKKKQYDSEGSHKSRIDKSYDRVNIRSFFVGRGVRLHYVFMPIIYAGRAFRSSENPLLTFIYAVILYFTFPLIIIVILGGGLLLFPTFMGVAAKDPGEFLLYVWQMLVVIGLLMIYLLFIITPQFAAAGINMFVRGVYLDEWRGILWRTLVAPLVGGAFVMGMAWLIALLWTEIPLVGWLIALVYVQAAYIVTFFSVATMTVGVLSFFREMNKYLYHRAKEGETINVTFFIMFSALKGIMVMTIVPLVFALVRIIANNTYYTVSYTVGQENKFSEILVEEIGIFNDYVTNLALGILAIIIVISIFALEIFDLFQLANVAPALIRDAVLKSQRIVMQGEIRGINIGLIIAFTYGSVIMYIFFTYALLEYIIPALLGVTWKTLMLMR